MSHRARKKFDMSMSLGEGGEQLLRMLRACVFLAEDTSQTCQLIASIELED